MKFTVTIQELAEAYKNKKREDSFYICNFIEYDLLPRKSIFHKLYFMFVSRGKSSNCSFLQQFSDYVHGKPGCVIIEDSIMNHKDFADISIDEGRYRYRLLVLERAVQLYPNLTFAYNY